MSSSRASRPLPPHTASCEARSQLRAALRCRCLNTTVTAAKDITMDKQRLCHAEQFDKLRNHHRGSCLSSLYGTPVLLLPCCLVKCSWMMSLVVHRPRKSSLPATQPMPSSLASAGTPPLHRGSPYSRSLPESSQSSTLYHYGSSPQAALRLSSASVTSPVSNCSLAHALQS